LSNSSTKFKSRLETHELLDRFELLYDNIEELKDLRRAYIDKDVSSIVRIIDNNNKENLLRFIMDDHIWGVWPVLDQYAQTQFVKAFKNFFVNDIKIDNDCFSRGQLHSKKWLVSELEKTSLHLGTVFLCAGWYGTLATMLFESSKIHLDKIRSFDIDENCWRIAETFNKPWVMDDWKFKATTQDIHKINFNEYAYTTLRSNGTERELFDKPNTIINTSCEHIENWDKWWASIPKGKLCILQSNDYKALPEHINCVDDVDHFKTIAPMTTYFYGGSLILGKYTRYMLIGIK